MVTDEANTTIKTIGANGQYGIGAFSDDGVGTISVTTSTGDTIDANGTGIIAEDDAVIIPSADNSSVTVTAYGTINSGTQLTQGGSPPGGILAGYNPDAGKPDTNVTGTVTVNNFANITAAAGSGISAYNYGNGDVTVNDNYGSGAVTGGTAVSGQQYGIIAQADSGGSGDVTVNIGANATISTSNASTGLVGIAAFSQDTGNITVSMSAGDMVTSGSAGVAAVSFAATDPAGAAITVTANGTTINSGTNLAPDGNLPAGIAAGYNPDDNATYDSNVTGSVSVSTNDVTINAAAGFGIQGFTFGSGDVSITTDAETSITVTAASTNGNLSADAGIAAFALDGGNASIANSGTVTAATGIALQAAATTPDGDGTGTVTVTNSGSVSGGISITTDDGLGTFQNEGAGQVTYDGTTVLYGDVTVTGTGTVLSISSANVDLAGDAGSTADMIVTAPTSGPTGSIDASGGMEVGYGGSATLTVEDGAQVIAGFINIGQLSGSQGTVDISGTGTTVTVTAGEYQDIAVGFDGTASLTISDQAAVTTSWMYVGAAYVAGVTDQFTLNDATLNLTEGIIIGNPGTADAIFENDAIVNAGTTGSLIVGNGGAGTLTIESGANVTADFLNIGSGSGSDGIVNITGPGTTVTTTAGQYQNIGVGFGGAASLTISDSATVMTTSMEVGADSDPGAIATLTVESGASLTVTDGLTIGAAGSADAIFEGGASVAAGSLDLATQSGVTAVVTITGTGTVVTASSLGLGAGLATLTVSDGATMDITGTATGTGSVTIEGGTIDFAATSNVGEITFNNGISGTTYGELILGSPSGYTATVSGFTGTAPSLSDSDGIDLAGTWTQESQTASGGNLIEVLTNGSATVTLTFEDFSGSLNLARSGGNTLITDPPPTPATNPVVSIGGPGGTEFCDAPATNTTATSAVGSTATASGACSTVTLADASSAGALNTTIVPQGSSDLGSLSAGAVTSRE
jgi:T5SS/PEP-CTERM-associated repeat protein